jgi:hypothetical protein
MVVAGQENSTQTVAIRTASFAIKVVLLGFDEQVIDKDYLTWNSPLTRYQLFQIPGVSTNTEYSMNYEYVFPSDSFTDDFAAFLESAGKVELRQNVIWNISYSRFETGYYWNYTHLPVQSSNTYYPADAAEDWLTRHQAGFGGYPENGYVLVLADLSNHLPSATIGQFELALQSANVVFTPHFYNKTYEDSDLGMRLNRRYMTAWGGHSRLFFADLSAGPHEAAEQLPIQVAVGANSINLSTVYGKYWLNQFLADYLYGAVYNLFTPDFVYPINYASSYNLKVVVVDNRTDTIDPSITRTFDEEVAIEELQPLVPWADVSAETQYIDINDYPELEQIIINSLSPASYGSQPGSFAVDARPVYEWLSESSQGRIKDFMEVKRDLEEFDIPVFAFAFSGDYEFGFTYKEMVARDQEFDRTIWGVALYDLVLISHSTDDLRRGDNPRGDYPSQPGKGFGFTNTVIHEVGHMFGLMHPFGTSYDPTENFVASVMAYYPYEQSFSVFDRDALSRGMADLLLRETARLLAETPSVLISGGDLSTAKSKLDSAEKAYSAMDYATAVKDAFDALTGAANDQFLEGAVSVLVGLGIGQLLVGIVVGVAVGYVIFRPKAKARSRAAGGPVRTEQATVCWTCGKPLTWIPEYSRWYCYNCRKYQ